MNDAVLVAIITGAISLLGSVCTLVTQNRLTQYRISQLEVKVTKHNNIVERIAVVERDVKTVFHRVDELREDIREVK